MTTTYSRDRDTLHIALRPGGVAETSDLDEKAPINLDAEGDICAIRVERAREHAGSPHFPFERMTAR